MRRANTAPGKAGIQNVTSNGQTRAPVAAAPTGTVDRAMPRAQFAVTIPSGDWLGEFSRRNRRADVSLQSAVRDDETGTCVLHLQVEPSPAIPAAERREDWSVPDECRGTLAEFGAVQCVDDVSDHGDHWRGLVEVECDPILAAADAARTPVSYPIPIRDGVAIVRVSGPRPRLATLGDHLDAAGVSWRVDWIRRGSTSEALLTPAQWRILRTALERGYYESPRECTLTELADALDIAKSTCSERLHLAQATVVKHLLEQHPTAGDDPAGDATGEEVPPP